eukprot:scaffold3108_cov152-Cylindrotheca_fusiformis.AAC.7
MLKRLRLFNDEETRRKMSMLEPDDDQSAGTYAKMVEEVEKVSELLQETRTALKDTQEQLQISEQRSILLERKMEADSKEIEILSSDNKYLVQQDQKLRNEINRLENEAGGSLARRASPNDEDRLRREVDLLNKDLKTTRGKLQDSQMQVVTQKSHIESLEKLNARMSLNTGGGELGRCQAQLKEAQTEASNLLEEVARLRDELSLQKLVTKEREAMQKERQAMQIEDMETMMRSRIRGQDRDATSQRLLTQRIRKEVSEEVNASKDEEIKKLQEHFNSVYKEKETLKDRLDETRASILEAAKLKEENPRLKQEVHRLLGILEAARGESAAAISDLESKFRMQIQAMQEQQAREKWTNMSEMRQKWSTEREKELEDYRQRMKALAEETSRLLKNAEVDKEEYASRERKRIEEEKQQEIDALQRKMEHSSEEAESLLKNTIQEKDAQASQFRKKIEKKVRHEIKKYKSRVQLLERENKTLKSRLVELGKQSRSNQEEKTRLDGEVNLLRKENTKLSNQLKSSEQKLKATKGERFNLKRKNEMLRHNEERYKTALDEKDKEFISAQKSKKLEEEASRLRNEVASHMQSKKLLEKELLCANKEIYELRVEKESLDISLASAQSEIVKLGISLSSSKKELQEKDVDSGRTRKELADSNKQVARLTEKIQRLQIHRNEFEESHKLALKELGDLKHPFKKEEILTELQQNSLHIEPETEQLYASTGTTEKRNHEQIEQLESLISAAARESLKISKRLHECDRSFRLLLADIDMEHLEASAPTKKHAADVESRSQGNVKLARELQTTMRNLKETFLRWKKKCLGFQGELNATKLQFDIGTRNFSQIESGEAPPVLPVGTHDNTLRCTKIPSQTLEGASIQGILVLPPSDEEKTRGVNGTSSVSRRRVSWNLDSTFKDLEYEDIKSKIRSEQERETRTRTEREGGTSRMTQQQTLHLPDESVTIDGVLPVEPTCQFQDDTENLALNGVDILNKNSDFLSCSGSLDLSHSSSSTSLDRDDSDNEEPWDFCDSADRRDAHSKAGSSLQVADASKCQIGLPTIEKAPTLRRALRDHPRRKTQNVTSKQVQESTSVSNTKGTPSDESRDEIKQTDRSIDELDRVAVEEERPFDE